MARAGERQSSAHKPFDVRRRPWLGKRVLLLLIALAAVIFFLPVVVSRTELRHRVIPWLAPDLAARIQFGSAELSWLSPARLENVSVVTSDGEPLFEAAHIVSQKTLLQMAMGYQDVGFIEISKPRLQLILTEQGTNLDALVASLNVKKDPREDSHDSEAVGFGVEIVDGEITIEDRVTGELCQLDQLTARIRSPRDVAHPVEVQLATSARTQQKQGTVVADFTWQRPQKVSAVDLGSGELKLESRSFPLATLTTVFRRSNLDASTSGDLTGNITCNWAHGQNGPELTAQGQLSGTHLQASMPSVLGSDIIASEMFTVSLDASVEQQQLNLTALDMASEFGQLQVSAAIPLAELFDESLIRRFLTYQSRHRLSGKGRLDLRQIAATLPHTLRLRNDTSIVGGEITFDIHSQHTDSQTRQIQGRLTTQEIVVSNAGKTIVWKQPMELDIHCQSQANGFAVDRFACQSDFLQATAAGTLTSGSLQAKGDLDKLVDQLQQICDLGTMQIAGRFSAQGEWSTSTNQSYVAKARANVENFQLVYGQVPPWQERNLEISLEADGVANGPSLTRLNRLDAQVVSGTDQLVAQITGPVDNPSTQSTWPVSCKVTGQLATWTSRLRPWLGNGAWQLDGTLNASAVGEVSVSRAQLAPIEVEVTNLLAISGTRRIQEPVARASGEAVWEGSRGMVSIPQLEAVSSTIALRGKDIQVTLGDELQADGAAAFRGDLNRIAALWQDPSKAPTQDYRGNVQGTVQLTTRDGVINFTGTSSCGEFALLTRKVVPTVTLGPQSTWTEAWREAQLQLSASGRFQPANTTVTFEQLRLAGDVAQLQASGAIRHLATDPVADMSGEIEYDLYGIVAKMRNWIGTGIELVGRQRHPFSLRGPLAMQSLQIGQANGSLVRNASLAANAPSSIAVIHRDLSAEAQVGWDRAAAYGVDFGPQQVSLLLKQGILSTSPIESKLVGGLVSLSPRVELATYPMALVLDERTKVQAVKITPAMCEDWIKYVAPLLAGTTTAEGVFSASLSSARVPLDQPMLADASGVVTIEQARVQPGPAAQQLLTALREAANLAKANAPNLSFLNTGSNWLEIQQQNVEFQMTQGRVYHRNLTLALGNVPVQTSGWVAVDQTMSVVAQIPIQESWVKNDPLLAGLSGQTIQIPIHGSLSQPQLDTRSFAQMTQQIIGNTAERYLHNELEKGLKKLLGPK